MPAQALNLSVGSVHCTTQGPSDKGPSALYTSEQAQGPSALYTLGHVQEPSALYTSGHAQGPSAHGLLPALNL